MRWRRKLLIVTAVTAALPIAALGIFILTINPNNWKPRMQEAVMRATGRALSLNGPISLKWALVPTIEARDVALANIDGGSQPQMVTAQSVEAEVALLSLLSSRIEIPRLVMHKPDILIETTRDDRNNWAFDKPDAKNATPEQAAPTGRPPDIVVTSVKVDDGTLTWHNAGTGQRVTVALNSIELLEPTETSPVTLDILVIYAGTPFTGHGETGSIARLLDTVAKTPWAAKLTVTAHAAEVLLDVQSVTPIQPASFSGTVSGKLADLALLQLFMPRTILPSVQGLSFNATIANASPPLARITDVTLHAGVSDLSAYAPGLSLTHADIRMPRMDQAATVRVEGSYVDAPLKLLAAIGTPGALISGQASSVDASLAVAGATITARGTLADPARFNGADLVVNARIPALAPFAALVRWPMPDLKDIAFDAHLTEAKGGFTKGIALTQATLSLPQGDIVGDASVAFTQRPSITANVASKRIDLDALLDAKLVDPPGLPATVGQPVISSPTATAPPPKPRGSSGLLFSDVPLGFGVLHTVDADVRLRISELRTGGQTDRDIAGHVDLKDGKLVLDPISGTLPVGKMSGRVAIDANPPQPPVALVLRAPGLSLRALALALGLPSSATGALEVDANLAGAGDSLHAIAAGLNGSLGLAMVNGAIDNAALNHLLGPILTSASLPLSLLSPGQSIRGVSALRCFAARLDARDGLAAFRALYLDSARVKVSGDGTINLATETLSLRLRPLARLADTGITVPLIVGGTIEHPNARVDAANSLQANITGLAQSARNLAEVPLGAISGALGGPDRLSTGGDDCANQLAIARGGPGGPQPNTPPSLLAVPVNAAKKILNAPKNLLRDVFGK